MVVGRKWLVWLGGKRKRRISERVRLQVIPNFTGRGHASEKSRVSCPSLCRRIPNSADERTSASSPAPDAPLLVYALTPRHSSRRSPAIIPHPQRCRRRRPPPRPCTFTCQRFRSRIDPDLIITFIINSCMVSPCVSSYTAIHGESGPRLIIFSLPLIWAHPP